MSVEIQEVTNQWNWQAISAGATVIAVFGAFGVAWLSHYLAVSRATEERDERRKAALQMIYQEVEQLDLFFTAIEFFDDPHGNTTHRKALGKIAFEESDFDPRLPEVLADTRFEVVVALSGKAARCYAIAAARRREIIRSLRQVFQRHVVTDPVLQGFAPTRYSISDSNFLPEVVRRIQRAATEGYEATRYLMHHAEKVDPGLKRDQEVTNEE